MSSSWTGHMVSLDLWIVVGMRVSWALASRVLICFFSLPFSPTPPLRSPWEQPKLAHWGRTGKWSGAKPPQMPQLTASPPQSCDQSQPRLTELPSCSLRHTRNDCWFLYAAEALCYLLQGIMLPLDNREVSDSYSLKSSTWEFHIVVKIAPKHYWISN